MMSSTRRERCNKGNDAYLYVKVSETLNTEVEFASYFNYRLGNRIPFVFCEANTDRETKRVTCCLRFRSKNQARLARSLFHKMNKDSSTKLWCSESKEDSKYDEEKNKIILENHSKEIAEQAELCLANHEKKVRFTENELLIIILQTHVGTQQYEALKTQRKVTEDKKEELLMQKQEFLYSQKWLNEKMKQLENEPELENKIKEFRKAFGIECCRLKNAFPIYAKRSSIIKTVLSNQVSIILGETGSGKSTQMVQYLYQAGLAEKGLIVCTQPRKVAATTIAIRVASEMVSNVGHLVGYHVGMCSKRNSLTKILYMTDHILLNECLKDDRLSAYSCIIIDEAHERSIYTDLLLGVLKNCLSKRPDLKVVITSATIEPQVFVDYFGCCQILYVSGRMFPVEVIWQDAKQEPFQDYEAAALEKAVKVHCSEEAGDILVFLTSALETERCCQRFKQQLKNQKDFECFQLHGRLQPNEQQQVFEPSSHGKRKIVFATNFAETSVTILGVRYVIDTGLVKEMQFNPQKNIHSLSVCWTSKSSAEQRKGRAGRTTSGKCFRLYSMENYKQMEKISKPEILRINLGQALLKLFDLGVDPLGFDYVESPGEESLHLAITTLEDLGAVKDKMITELGTSLSKLPFDPKLGWLALEGIHRGLGVDAVILASLCAFSGNVFYRSGTVEEKRKSDVLHVQFCNVHGDCISLLNVYHQWTCQPEKEKSKWCVENSINAKTMRSVREIVSEVLLVLRKELHTDVKPTETKFKENICRHLLFDCFNSNLCYYLGHQRLGYHAWIINQTVHMHPSSTLRVVASEPQWIVFQSIMKTSRDFVLNVTPVEEEWIVKAVNQGQLNAEVFSLKDKVVKLVVTRGLGTCLLRGVSGPKFTRLRAFEQEIQAHKTSTIIDFNQKQRELRGYSTADVASEIKSLVQGYILPYVEEIQNEDHETSLGDPKGNVDVIIGKGGCVKDVLMPDQFRTVHVKMIPLGTDEAAVKNKMSRFGRILKCAPVQADKHDKVTWGRVTFEYPEDAAAAVDGTQNDHNLIAKPIRYGTGKRPDNFSVQLTWNRRKCKGFAFVKFKHIEDKIAIFQRRHLFVNGSIVYMKLSNKDSESLFLQKIPHDCEDYMIEDTISYILNTGRNQIKDQISVNIPRENVTTTAEQLEDIKRQLVSEISKFAERGQFTVVIKPTKPKDFIFVAWVSFVNPEVGQAACNLLKVYIRGAFVKAVPKLSNTLHILERVYKVLSTDLDIYINELKRRNLWIEVKKQKSGNYIVKVESNSFQDIVNAKQFLQQLLQGDVFECGMNESFRILFTKEGREHLQAIESETETVFIVDYRSMTVGLFGSQGGCTRAKILLNRFLEEMSQSELRWVSLCDGRPRGLMKQLIVDHGMDLERLRTDISAVTVELNFVQQCLHVRGGDDTFRKLEEKIRKAAESLPERVVSEEQNAICVVCFCEIEENQLYRMEICGHAYCKECFECQIDSAIKGKNFPVKCAKDGCEEGLAWQDFVYAIKIGITTISGLIEASLSKFVVQNKEKFHYCITPNCSMVYRTSESGRLFECNKCYIQICTSCHTEYHHGFTCSMCQSMKLDEGNLEKWIKDNPLIRTLCPKCKTPIEKNGGCEHIHCTACNIHICWICKGTFDSSNKCYEHIRDFGHR